VGACVVARAAAGARLAFDVLRFDGQVAQGWIGSQEIVLLLPQTYMNRSGASVAAALGELEDVVPARDLLVVLDDADLPLGRLRLRARGGAGGHRGLADILEALASEAVPRLRFGIGRPASPMGTVEFVLDRFDPGEAQQVEDAVEHAAAAVECFVTEGIEKAMNRFNAPATP
jgi:peptidyl-tRNA hydrolase, PTH1 family